MDYTALITRSWNIVWKNKVLWLLGFLAGLAAGGGQVGNSYNSNSGSEMSSETLAAMGAMLVVLSCIAVIVVVVVWVLSTAARGGLIGSVSLLDDDETATLTVGEAMQPGLKAFWRMIGINILLSLPFILLFGVMMALVFVMVGGTAVFASLSEGADAAIASLGIMLVCIVLFICLLVPVGLVVQLIQAFAVRGAVLRDLGIIESIQHGWQVLRQNVAEIVLLGLLFAVIGLVYGIGVGIITIPVALVMMAPALGMVLSGGELGGLSVVWLVCGGIGVGLLAAALLSILTAWRSATFTLAYKQFTDYEKKPENLFDTNFDTDFDSGLEPKWHEE